VATPHQHAQLIESEQTLRAAGGANNLALPQIYIQLDCSIPQSSCCRIPLGSAQNLWKEWNLRFICSVCKYKKGPYFCQRGELHLLK
jgi:5-methylcytosine-specific restriction endonuclease McrA